MTWTGGAGDVELTATCQQALGEAEALLVGAVRTHFGDALSELQLTTLTEMCETLTRHVSGR